MKDKSPESPSDTKSLERLGTLLANSKTFLEFGSGSSTLLAGKLGVPTVVSTESDRQRCKQVRAKFSPAYLRSLLFSIHVNIDPPRSRAAATAKTRQAGLPPYAAVAWRFASHAKLRPDLIRIGGSFRSACFLNSLAKARPGTRILFEDYERSPCCGAADRVIRPVEFHGTTAEFLVPTIDRAEVEALIERLLPVVRDLAA
ncbi:MAG: hypothetical protein ACT4PZ_19195 [Panacagrimonas sp.]